MRANGSLLHSHQADNSNLACCQENFPAVIHLFFGVELLKL